MDMLRRFGLSVAVLAFSFCLSAVAVCVGLYVVFDTSGPLKQALRTSDVYTITAQDSLPPAAETSLPVSDPGIQQAFETAFPPSFAQDTTEGAIDTVYAWVHETAPSPDFSISLTPVKTNFANNMAQYVEQKIAALPLCSQVIAPPTTADELLNLTCRPRGVSLEQISQTVRQEVLSSSLFAEGDAITTASFKDTNGQPISEQLSFVPALHRYFVISLYVLPGLAVLTIIAIIFWSTTKRAGIKRVGWVLVVIGLANAVFAVVQVWFLHAGASIFAPASASPALQTKLLNALEILAVQLRDWWLGFSAGYVVLGIILLLVLAFTKPKQKMIVGNPVIT